MILFITLHDLNFENTNIHVPIIIQKLIMVISDILLGVIIWNLLC